MKMFLKTPAPVAVGIDPAFFNQVAQFAHFFTMFGLLLSVAIFFTWKWVLIASALEIAYAAIHEFVWDPREENSATRGSDLEDFLFLLGGNCTAWVVYFLAVHFGRLV